MFQRLPHARRLPQLPAPLSAAAVPQALRRALRPAPIRPFPGKKKKKAYRGAAMWNLRGGVVSDVGGPGRSEARLPSVRPVGHRHREQRRRRGGARVRCGSGVLGSIHPPVLAAVAPSRCVSPPIARRLGAERVGLTFGSPQDAGSSRENALTAGNTEIRMPTGARGCWWSASAIPEAISPWRSADVPRR